MAGGSDRSKNVTLRETKGHFVAFVLKKGYDSKIATEINVEDAFGFHQKSTIFRVVKGWELMSALHFAQYDRIGIVWPKKISLAVCNIHKSYENII